MKSAYYFFENPVKIAAGKLFNLCTFHPATPEAVEQLLHAGAICKLSVRRYAVEVASECGDVLAARVYKVFQVRG